MGQCRERGQASALAAIQKRQEATDPTADDEIRTHNTIRDIIIPLESPRFPTTLMGARAEPIWQWIVFVGTWSVGSPA